MLPSVQKILKFSAFLHFACLYRHALDIREHYERKLERANNLYMELSAIMLQLEVREKELMKYVKKLCFTVDIGRLPCYHIFHYQASLVVSQATVLSFSKAFIPHEIFEMMSVAFARMLAACSASEKKCRRQITVSEQFVQFTRQ